MREHVRRWRASGPPDDHGVAGNLIRSWPMADPAVTAKTLTKRDGSCNDTRIATGEIGTGRAARFAPGPPTAWPGPPPGDPTEPIRDRQRRSIGWHVPALAVPAPMAATRFRGAAGPGGIATWTLTVHPAGPPLCGDGDGGALTGQPARGEETPCHDRCGNDADP